MGRIGKSRKKNLGLTRPIHYPPSISNLLPSTLASGGTCQRVHPGDGPLVTLVSVLQPHWPHHEPPGPSAQGSE